MYLSDGTLVVQDLVVDDPVVLDLVSGREEDEQAELLRRALSVGARGLLTMGLGIDIEEVDVRVRRSVEQATAEARRRIEHILDKTTQALEDELDPDKRSSRMARTVREFETWREEFFTRFDPDTAGSHTARLLQRLERLVGPGGELQRRLESLLDPGEDGSILGPWSNSVDKRLVELRDLLMRELGRAAEAEGGTRKGFEFEQEVETHLRTAALAIGGCAVEATSTLKGDLSAGSVVGDFVVTLPTGHRVVVEAKNTARIGLKGGGGILEELDRAVANRRADFAICVSARDAFPIEVGRFGVYGERLLVVDEHEGTMIAVALRWAAAVLSSDSGPEDAQLDFRLIEDRLQRLKALAQLLSNSRRSLTTINSTVNDVQDQLDGLRRQLLSLVDEVASELGRAVRGSAPVLQLRRDAAPA